MPYLPIVNAMAPKAPDWRDLHDPVDHEEKDVGSFFNKFVDWVTGAGPRTGGKAKMIEEDKTWRMSPAQRPDNGGGNDMKQKVQSRLGLFGCCIH